MKNKQIKRGTYTQDTYHAHNTTTLFYNSHNIWYDQLILSNLNN